MLASHFYNVKRDGNDFIFLDNYGREHKNFIPSPVDKELEGLDLFRYSSSMAISYYVEFDKSIRNKSVVKQFDSMSI